MTLRATHILKQNIDALLHARNHTRQDLALWTLRTVNRNRANSWISHIFGPKGYESAEIKGRYLDRIADFFGLAVYQLYQPGIARSSERRSGTERRRTQGDRRISARPRQLATTTGRQIDVSPESEQILNDLNELPYEVYQRVRGWIHVAKLGTGSERKTQSRLVAPEVIPATTQLPVVSPRRRRR